MNRWLILLVFAILINPSFAFDLDETVDDEIRKNYGTEEEKLPALPTITKYTETKVPDVKSQAQSQPQFVIKTQLEEGKTYQRGKVKLKKGMTINVTNSTAISDWQTAGTQVKFKTKQPIYGKNYTIPAATIFNGEIVESHKPQITGNGGLVVIKVYSMRYNGQEIPVNAYITRANDKKIFLNNIKGERTYLKTMWKKGDWGRVLFNKMMALTVSLGSEGSTFILSPLPVAYGTICLGANAIISPFCAFFSKGGHVSIPAGQGFKIRLLEDAII